MSTATALAPSPRRSPREVPQRRVEIVSTRAQRRARPRPLYAIIAVGGILGLFLAQLLMSIAVSDGAYQISSLQAEQVSLTRQQQSLGEQVDTLASTQNLAVKAAALGMVQSTALPAFLDVTTGKVIGTSHSAKGSGSSTSTGVNLIANSLLPDATSTAGVTTAELQSTAGGATVVDPTDPTAGGTTTDATSPTDAPTTGTTTTGTTTIGTTTTGTTTDTAAGAPALTTNTTPVASQSGLPIPVTH